MTSNIENMLMPGEEILIESRQHWLTILLTFWLIIPVLKWMKASVAITNKRVIGISGIFSPDTFESRLNRVSGIKLNQSLMGRMMNYGTVIITTTGGEKYSYNNIVNAKKLRETFNLALDKFESSK